MTIAQHSPVGPQRTPWKLSGGYLFVAPAVLYIVLLVFLPTVRVASLSLTQTIRLGGGTRFVGLENFKTILSDPLFRRAVAQTFQWSILTTIGDFTLGFFLALAMNSALVYKRIEDFVELSFYCLGH